MTAPTLEELLQLDSLCLREASGGPLDLDAHRARLTQSMAQSRFAWVRRSGALVAYGYMWPRDAACWFVGGLAIHPHHRNAGVTAELLDSFIRLVSDSGARELHSHVLATNTASLKLHRRLGFTEAQRNDTAIAFVVSVVDLAMNALSLRARDR